MLSYDFVKLYPSRHDRKVVELYERLYQKQVISLEVTKPSEQAFKALINPHKIGGPVLLFSMPLGRQEWDNLAFLMRHNLIAQKEQKEFLWEKARGNEHISKEQEALFLRGQVKHWRALELPQDPKEAATFIQWCLVEGIFARMMEYPLKINRKSRSDQELGDEGVKKVWEGVASLVKSFFTHLES
jgi:hypothetical protein